MQRGEEHDNQRQQQGGRRGEPGHLRPDNDAADDTGRGGGGQIAQNQQQSSGQGSGQS